jgi:acetyl-CoA acetyltransferase
MTTAACQAAIEDAGLTTEDIDGLTSLGDTSVRQAATALGIQPHWTGGGFDTGGLLTPVMDAALAVARGDARHVVVYRTVQMMGGSILPADREGGDGAEHPRMPAADWMGPLLTMHAYSAANWVAMHCMRHMHLYGTTKEQLGAVAVTSRSYAAQNPNAAYRAPITLDDYLAARPISDPFGLLDCDVPVDGSIALVLSGTSHADACPNAPVRVHALGGARGDGGWDHRPDYPRMASADAASEMWARSDLGPGDVDVAELYDGFTFLVLAWLEALGLCGEGESGPFVEGGIRIGPGGELPINTYGGQLSAGRMHGYWVLHEAVHQLRGSAGSRQVANAEVAVVAAGGGPIAGCMALTR